MSKSKTEIIKERAVLNKYFKEQLELQGFKFGQNNLFETPATRQKCKETAEYIRQLVNEYNSIP